MTQLTKTDSVVQSSSRAAKSHSAGKEILDLLWNRKLQYRVHMISLLSQSHPHTHIRLRFFLIGLSLFTCAPVRRVFLHDKFTMRY